MVEDAPDGCVRGPAAYSGELLGRRDVLGVSDRHELHVAERLGAHQLEGLRLGEVEVARGGSRSTGANIQGRMEVVVRVRPRS